MDAKKTLALTFAVLTIAVSFLGGSFFQKKYPEFLGQMKKMLLDGQHTMPETEGFVLSEEQIASLLKVRSIEDGLSLRRELWHFLTGEPAVGGALPEVEKLDDSRYVVRQRFGLDSNIIVSSPGLSSTLVILHRGHKPSNAIEDRLEQALVKAGLTVARFDMPLIGSNRSVDVELADFGRIKLRSHNHMELLEYHDTSGHPLQYFVSPVLSFARYMLETKQYASIAMVGFSGGGWTTVLSAALEPRIEHSIHVASSYPFFLRTLSSSDWGDYEQHNMDLYHVANYLDLYTLGALEQNRSQLQVVIENDSCCYGGHGGEEYQGVLQRNLMKIGGGTWQLDLDRSIKKHDVSPATEARIVEVLRAIEGARET